MQVSGSNITIPAIKLPDGTMSKSQAVDLITHQGIVVRIYVDATGKTQINPKRECYWQVCELSLPPEHSEQVQQGVVAQSSSSERMITRGSSASDTITLASGESVGRVGFSWHPYAHPDDYSEVKGILKWIANHGPKSGDTYNIEIITTINEPNMISQIVPLDLTTTKITTFPAPV